MNQEKVQEAINNIVLKNRLERQYPASKTQLRELDELGLTELMPICKHPSVRGIGHTDAKLVLEAANDSGKVVGGLTAYGDGDVTATEPSDLYKALHDETTEEPSPDDDAQDEDIRVGDTADQDPDAYYELTPDAAERRTKMRGYEYIYESLLARQEYREFCWQEGDNPSVESFARWYLAMLYGAPQDAREWMTKEEMDDFKADRANQIAEIVKKVRCAEAYFAEGFRIAITERSIAGVNIDVPELALYHTVIPSGYLATNPTFRVSYLYKTGSPDDLNDVMTPAEIEREFGLAAGTVRQAIRRGSFELYRKSDERTYLIARSDAEARWGKQESEMMAAKVETSVFKARELEADAKGWRVSVYYPGELFDERGWWFRTKREAREFARRVEAGEQPHRVYDEMLARPD